MYVHIGSQTLDQTPSSAAALLLRQHVHKHQPHVHIHIHPSAPLSHMRVSSLSMMHLTALCNVRMSTWHACCKAVPCDDSTQKCRSTPAVLCPCMQFITHWFGLFSRRQSAHHGHWAGSGLASHQASERPADATDPEMSTLDGAAASDSAGLQSTQAVRRCTCTLRPNALEECFRRQATIMLDWQI